MLKLTNNEDLRFELEKLDTQSEQFRYLFYIYCYWALEATGNQSLSARNIIKDDTNNIDNIPDTVLSTLLPTINSLDILNCQRELFIKSLHTNLLTASNFIYDDMFIKYQNFTHNLDKNITVLLNKMCEYLKIYLQQCILHTQSYPNPNEVLEDDVLFDNLTNLIIDHTEYSTSLTEWLITLYNKSIDKDTSCIEAMILKTPLFYLYPLYPVSHYISLITLKDTYILSDNIIEYVSKVFCKLLKNYINKCLTQNILPEDFTEHTKYDLLSSLVDSLFNEEFKDIFVHNINYEQVRYIKPVNMNPLEDVCEHQATPIMFNNALDELDDNLKDDPHFFYDKITFKSTINNGANSITYNLDIKYLMSLIMQFNSSKPLEYISLHKFTEDYLHKGKLNIMLHKIKVLAINVINNLSSDIGTPPKWFDVDETIPSMDKTLDNDYINSSYSHEYYLAYREFALFIYEAVTTSNTIYSIGTIRELLYYINCFVYYLREYNTRVTLFNLTISNTDYKLFYNHLVGILNILYWDDIKSTGHWDDYINNDNIIQSSPHVEEVVKMLFTYYNQGMFNGGKMTRDKKDTTELFNPYTFGIVR